MSVVVTQCRPQRQIRQRRVAGFHFEPLSPCRANVGNKCLQAASGKQYRRIGLIAVDIGPVNIGIQHQIIIGKMAFQAQFDIGDVFRLHLQG